MGVARVCPAEGSNCAKTWSKKTRQQPAWEHGARASRVRAGLWPHHRVGFLRKAREIRRRQSTPGGMGGGQQLPCGVLGIVLDEMVGCCRRKEW